MPFVQIIPYVADQFDPGAYVFDGGTFDSKETLKGAPVSVYDVSKSAFDSSELLLGGGIDLGVYVPSTATFDSRDLLQGRVIIFLEGVDFNTRENFTVLSQQSIMFSEVQFNSSINAEALQDLVFTRLIEGEVQNSIGNPNSSPRMVDSGTAVTRATLETPIYNTASIPNTSERAEFTGNVIELSGTVDIDFSETASFNLVDLDFASLDELTFLQVNSNSIDTNDFIVITSLITQSETQGTSNSPEFTM